MAQYHLDLPLSPDIHLQIVLGAHFPVAASRFCPTMINGMNRI
jgi:hypothetical protein